MIPFCFPNTVHILIFGYISIVLWLNNLYIIECIIQRITVYSILTSKVYLLWEHRPTFPILQCLKC